jgi:hypothetical protein
VALARARSGRFLALRLEAVFDVFVLRLAVERLPGVLALVVMSAAYACAEPSIL